MSKNGLRLNKLPSDSDVGEFIVGDAAKSIAVPMVFGKAADLHAASLRLKERRYRLALDNWFMCGEPTRPRRGGTVVSHDVSFELPTLSGAWRVAALCSDAGERAGLMLWHVDTVGERCADAAKLVEQLASVCGDVFGTPQDSHELGILPIGRYDWTWQYGGPDDAERAWLPKQFKLLPEHEDVFGRNEQFHFLPPAFYLDRVWPWAKRAASAADGGDYADDSVDAAASVRPTFIRDGIHTLRDDKNSNIGVLSAIAAEYAFARVWMHRDERGRTLGAKAILSYTYNVGEDWPGHTIGDAVVQTDEHDDPTYEAVPSDEVNDAHDDAAAQLSDDGNISQSEIDAIVDDAKDFQPLRRQQQEQQEQQEQEDDSKNELAALLDDAKDFQPKGNKRKQR